MNIASLEIKKISVSEAILLSQLIESSEKEYSKYFTPFSFDIKSITRIFSEAKKDQYYGIYCNNNLIGFYMLRGFDKNYEIPSYGVWVKKEFSSFGIAKLTLRHAISFCKLNSIKRIMLKVHPENIIAKNTYESFGFINEGFDKVNNNLIYYKNI